MNDLISKEALKTIESIQSADFNSIETIREWIDNAPTIPAIPISDIEGIKAEIGSEMNITRDQYSIRQNDYCDGFVFAMKQVLEIIDKHIKEYTE